MPKPTVPDLSEMLQPIAGDNPAGADLEYSRERAAIAEARRFEERTAPSSEEAQRRDVWDRDYKEADHRKVIELAVPLLMVQSKDLMVSAWLTEALTITSGLGGLTYGLQLMHGIHDQFWDHFWPAKDDADPEMRHGPYLFLEGEKNIIRALRTLPLSGGGKDVRPYSIADYDQAKHRATHPGVEEAVEFTSQDIMEALRKSPWKDVHELMDRELAEAIQAWKAFTVSIDERFGIASAPATDRLTSALDVLETLLRPIFKEKRPAVAISAPAQVVATTMSSGGESAGALPVMGEIVASSGPLESTADAIGAILAGAGFLRNQDSHDPTPYLVIRALGAGSIYRQAKASSGGHAPQAPPSAHRQTLRRLISAGDWERALGFAESALGQPTGWAWLDAHRHSIVAMERTGRESAAKAARGLLRSALHDHPLWLKAELDDDTPAANHETQAWVATDLLEASAHDSGGHSQALVRAGRNREAVAMLDDAIARARSGRERFMRKLELAELFLELNQPRPARSHLEELKALIDEKKLDDWEDKSLCVRTYQAIRKVYLALGEDEAAGLAFDRICRWEPSRALEE